jgi:hypothetical protein
MTLLGFQHLHKSMYCQSNQEPENELSNSQLSELVHYFGIDSADSSESLVEGIDALVKLQRS